MIQCSSAVRHLFLSCQYNKIILIVLLRSIIKFNLFRRFRIMFIYFFNDRLILLLVVNYIVNGSLNFKLWIFFTRLPDVLLIYPFVNNAIFKS